MHVMWRGWRWGICRYFLVTEWINYLDWRSKSVSFDLKWGFHYMSINRFWIVVSPYAWAHTEHSLGGSINFDLLVLKTSIALEIQSKFYMNIDGFEFIVSNKNYINECHTHTHTRTHAYSKHTHTHKISIEICTNTLQDEERKIHWHVNPKGKKLVTNTF